MKKVKEVLIKGLILVGVLLTLPLWVVAVIIILFNTSDYVYDEHRTAEEEMYEW